METVSTNKGNLIACAAAHKIVYLQRKALESHIHPAERTLTSPLFVFLIFTLTPF